MSSYSIREESGIYFLTSTIIGWVDIFSRKMYRDIVIESLKYCIDHKSLRLHAYVIMTNHMHWICSSKDGTLLNDIVRDFKKFTSKSINEAIINNNNESRKEWMLNLFSYAGRHHSDNKNYKLWQTGNHPEYIYSAEFIEQKLRYIDLNPVRAGIVEQPEQDIYSSARDYMGTKGIIEIEPLILFQHNNTGYGL
jgi:REP element-mobilizing transposase RayT